MTRNLLKKREDLCYFTNITRELQLVETEGFKKMMRMDLKHFYHILNLIAPDITSSLTSFFLKCHPTWKEMLYEYLNWFKLSSNIFYEKIDGPTSSNIVRKRI